MGLSGLRKLTDIPADVHHHLEKACQLSRDGNVRLPNGLSVTALLRSIIEELPSLAEPVIDDSACETSEMDGIGQGRVSADWAGVRR